MEITPARAQDIDAILDLWGELAAFHADLDPAFTPAAGWRAAYAGYLATLLGRPDARVLVAHQEGRIVGYGVARITVLPPFFAQRGRGCVQLLKVPVAGPGGGWARGPRRQHQKANRPPDQARRQCRPRPQLHVPSDPFQRVRQDKPRQSPPGRTDVRHPGA